MAAAANSMYLSLRINLPLGILYSRSPLSCSAAGCWVGFRACSSSSSSSSSSSDSGTPPTAGLAGGDLLAHESGGFVGPSASEVTSSKLLSDSSVGCVERPHSSVARVCGVSQDSDSWHARLSPSQHVSHSASPASVQAARTSESPQESPPPARLETTCDKPSSSCASAASEAYTTNTTTQSTQNAFSGALLPTNASASGGLWGHAASVFTNDRQQQQQQRTFASPPLHAAAVNSSMDLEEEQDANDSTLFASSLSYQLDDEYEDKEITYKLDLEDYRLGNMRREENEGMRHEDSPYEDPPHDHDMQTRSNFESYTGDAFTDALSDTRQLQAATLGDEQTAQTAQNATAEWRGLDGKRIGSDFVATKFDEKTASYMPIRNPDERNRSWCFELLDGPEFSSLPEESQDALTSMQIKYENSQLKYALANFQEEKRGEMNRRDLRQTGVDMFMEQDDINMPVSSVYGTAEGRLYVDHIMSGWATGRAKTIADGWMKHLRNVLEEELPIDVERTPRIISGHIRTRRSISGEAKDLKEVRMALLKNKAGYDVVAATTVQALIAQFCSTPLHTHSDNLDPNYAHVPMLQLTLGLGRSLQAQANYKQMEQLSKMSRRSTQIEGETSSFNDEERLKKTIIDDTEKKCEVLYTRELETLDSRARELLKSTSSSDGARTSKEETTTELLTETSGDAVDLSHLAGENNEDKYANFPAVVRKELLSIDRRKNTVENLMNSKRNTGRQYVKSVRIFKQQSDEKKGVDTLTAVVEFRNATISEDFRNGLFLEQYIDEQGKTEQYPPGAVRPHPKINVGMNAVVDNYRVGKILEKQYNVTKKVLGASAAATAMLSLSTQRTIHQAKHGKVPSTPVVPFEEETEDESLLYGVVEHPINSDPSPATDSESWSVTTVVKIGAAMISLIVRAVERDATLNGAILKIDRAERIEKIGGRYTKIKTGVLGMKRDGVLDELISSPRAWRGGTSADTMPTIIPPKPWEDLNSGAFQMIKKSAIRAKGNFREVEGIFDNGTAKQKEDFRDTLSVLSMLGNIPWTINRPVAMVAHHIWTSDKSNRRDYDTIRNQVGMPSQKSIVPESLQKNEPMLSEPLARATPTETHGSLGPLTVKFSHNASQISPFQKFERKQKDQKKAESERYSLMRDMDYKIHMARDLSQLSEFYYPHSMDFRGRAYPMHPHLQHMGGDVARGMLSFKRAKPLGERGLRWLKIHLANLCGENKISLDEREEWVQRHADDVWDSAERPIDGRRWWMQQEEPFQVLATCIEIRNAEMHPNGPEQYLCRLPVHQDGSCNGLQHYAAMGRDALGGAAVNLTSAERPNDVYSKVMDRVKAKVEKTATSGEGRMSELASKLLPEVNRKLVKQTVMTSVYGVTWIGARDQIESRLRERGWPAGLERREVARYATDMTMSGLAELFQDARNVMAWLGTCASIVSKNWKFEKGGIEIDPEEVDEKEFRKRSFNPMVRTRDVEMCKQRELHSNADREKEEIEWVDDPNLHIGQPMRWTTPMGMVCVQPYRKVDNKKINTVLQTISVDIHSEALPVVSAKQRSAFAPNYVHSIDSAHMMKTAEECIGRGMDFAGVHDSFWTHPCSVDEMNVVLRDKFVEVHKEPLLEKLKAELEERHPHLAFPPVPKFGDLDLEEVRNSTYFFS